MALITPEAAKKIVEGAGFKASGAELADLASRMDELAHRLSARQYEQRNRSHYRPRFRITPEVRKAVFQNLPGIYIDIPGVTTLPTRYEQRFLRFVALYCRKLAVSIREANPKAKGMLSLASALEAIEGDSDGDSQIRAGLQLSGLTGMKRRAKEALKTGGSLWDLPAETLKDIWLRSSEETKETLKKLAPKEKRLLLERIEKKRKR